MCPMAYLVAFLSRQFAQPAPERFCSLSMCHYPFQSQAVDIKEQQLAALRSLSYRVGDLCLCWYDHVLVRWQIGSMVHLEPQTLQQTHCEHLHIIRIEYLVMNQEIGAAVVSLIVHYTIYEGTTWAYLI